MKKNMKKNLCNKLLTYTTKNIKVKKVEEFIFSSDLLSIIIKYLCINDIANICNVSHFLKYNIFHIPSKFIIYKDCSLQNCPIYKERHEKKEYLNSIYMQIYKMFIVIDTNQRCLFCITNKIYDYDDDKDLHCEMCKNQDMQCKYC